MEDSGNNTKNGFVAWKYAWLKNSLMQEPMSTHIWFHLMMNANPFKNSREIPREGRKNLQVHKGQLALNITAFAKDINISRNTLLKYIKDFQDQDYITYKDDHGWVLITILSWETYVNTTIRGVNR